MFLRTEFNLEMVDLNAELYNNFVGSIPSPSCVTLFKINELNGVSLLDVNSHLSATVVDKILGGRGSTNPEERGLTEIEKALVEDFNLIILEEWCKQWSTFKKLSPGIIGTETTGRFLQTSPPRCDDFNSNNGSIFWRCFRSNQNCSPLLHARTCLN